MLPSASVSQRIRRDSVVTYRTRWPEIVANDIPRSDGSAMATFQAIGSVAEAVARLFSQAWQPSQAILPFGQLRLPR
jgi:hypothetical protein